MLSVVAVMPQCLKVEGSSPFSGTRAEENGEKIENETFFQKWMMCWRQGTQNNDTQYNDTQHNDPQHNDTQPNTLAYYEHLLITVI